MRAPPFAKHPVLHAGTAETGGRKRRRVSFLSSPFASYRDKYPEESSLASAGCASTFAVVVPRRYASLLSVYARSPFSSRLRGRLNVCISVVPFYS